MASRARSGGPKLNRMNVWGRLNPAARLFFKERVNGSERVNVPRSPLHIHFTVNLDGDTN